MKKIVSMAVMACMLLVGVSAFAKQGDKSLEVTGTFGTEPASGVGSLLGGTVGAGVEVAKNIQVRGDFSYLRANKTDNGVELTYTRLPIDISGRYFIPVTQQLNVFGQGGLELSFDEAKGYNSNTLVSAKANETHFGVVLGAGGEFAINQQVGITANMLYHAIADGYLSVSAGVAFHF